MQTALSQYDYKSIATTPYLRQKFSVKYCLLITGLLLSTSLLNAQTKKTVPPFEIELTGGKGFTSKDLKADKQLMLIYFSPTCEHCQTFITDLLKNIEQLKNMQIVMISYLPIQEITKFETDFKLSQYTNIKVGTEGYSFIVQHWYNIQRFPFTALFNNKNILTAVYRDVPPMNVLMEKIKAN
jgi:thioredoxin-related protein